MIQKKKKVAIQGITGSYHEIAAKNYFADEISEIIPCNTFKDVIHAIHRDPSVLGLMAIENTIAGSLLPNHELIRQSNCLIIGEYKLRISHCLAALPESDIQDIVEINSHPIALMQCEEYIGKLKNIKIVEKEDTALSAQWIAENKLTGHAAICSVQAAETFGLKILAKGIETNKRNFTRFLILAHHQQEKSAQTKEKINKASVVFSLPHTSGSLSKVLSILSFYDMNLSKIQSLPIIGREWEYLFYINLNFSNYMRYKQSLDAIIPLTKEFKILGEYAEGKQNI